jgi:type II secretory pathway pseudopilin PulG
VSVREKDSTCPSEGGFALIEVVVSALIGVIVVGAVISLLSATGKAGAEQRRRSQAYAIAQEDQARLRSTRLVSLNTEMPSRTMKLNNTEYTVESSAKFISDKTGATACTGSNTGADYVQLGSFVTWTGMRTGASPVKIESIVSPVSGSLDPTSGSISIIAQNGAVPQVPISGVGLNATGPSNFSGSTDSNGCAVFGGLPAGDYTVTPSFGPGYVNPAGEEPKPKKVTVSTGSIAPLELLYDQASTVQLGFKVRNGSTGVVEATSGDAVVAVQNGLPSGAKSFGAPFVLPAGSPAGTPNSFKTPVEASPLFPFSSTYTFYAGSCTTNSPEAGSVSIKPPAGGTVSPAEATIQLPALYLTVKNSAGTTAEKAALSGATVTITDLKCSIGSPSTPVKRTYLTNSAGALANPGMPSSIYELCASKTISGTARRNYLKVKVGTVETKEVPVKSLTGTTATIDIAGAGFETGKTC